MCLAKDKGAFDVQWTDTDTPSSGSSSSRGSSSCSSENSLDGGALGVPSEEALLIAAATVGRAEREKLAQQFLLRIYGLETLRAVESKVPPHSAISVSPTAWTVQLAEAAAAGAAQQQQQQQGDEEAEGEAAKQQQRDAAEQQPHLTNSNSFSDSNGTASGSSNSTSSNSSSSGSLAAESAAAEAPTSRSFSIQTYGYYTACCLALDTLQQQQQQQSEKPKSHDIVLFSSLLMRQKQSLEDQWFAASWGPLLSDQGPSPSLPKMCTRDSSSSNSSSNSSSSNSSSSNSSSSRVMTVSARAIKDVTEDCRVWVRRRLLLPMRESCRDTGGPWGAPQGGPPGGPPDPELCAYMRQSEAVGIYNRKMQLLQLQGAPWADPRKAAAARQHTEERAAAPGYALRHRRRCPTSPNSVVIRGAVGEDA
ncbi:hypothetical protein ETH_00028295 [Eimeria tenella]|uniref:Uncharacterized protein n=1 Tax=Eimeria tenella TaxID=5802 RepID=U6L712_EIMTE|nr:hypothetical protein ETH_00028295 [Eimeria tenella]CDJ44983.1 hypothetical protein ETH_00028295 [Eimeria tenella]|eukprot:XP_013235730.1 hypothetical protein ETH_00028295 [Eimeria tenella]